MRIVSSNFLYDFLSKLWLLLCKILGSLWLVNGTKLGLLYLVLPVSLKNIYTLSKIWEAMRKYSQTGSSSINLCEEILQRISWRGLKAVAVTRPQIDMEKQTDVWT